MINSDVGINDRYAKIKEFAAIAGLLLLALISRSYHLGEWSLSADEIFSVTKASERYTSLINPAYYILILSSFKVFGVNEWSARLPAMILGSVSIPVFYVTWKNIVGRNCALFGSMLIVLSSWHLWYSQFSRFYSGVFFFGSLSYYFYYKAMRSEKFVFLFWAMFFNLIGIFFHVSSIIVAVSCFLFSIFILFTKKSSLNQFLKKNAKIYFALGCIGALISLPFFLKIAVGWHGSGQLWGYGPAKLTLQIIKYMQAPLVICAFGGLICILKRGVMDALFFVICLMIPVIALLVGSIFVSIRPDYMFYAYPLVFVLAGYFLEQVRVGLLGYGITSLIVIMLVVVCMLPESISHYTGRNSLDVREVSKFIESEHRSNDKVMSYVTELDYYMNINYTKISQLGYPYDDSVEWEKGFQRYDGKNERLWIILPIRRGPLAKNLEAWLFKNASLVWRKYAVRYDYTIEGYQVFLADAR